MNFQKFQHQQRRATEHNINYINFTHLRFRPKSQNISTRERPDRSDTTLTALYMVEKHRMIADFEKLTYTPEMLRKEWDKQVDHFESLIASGWTNRDVVELIEYIRQTEYGKTFFPGSSIGTLLISKPEDGKLNYQQTLAISVNNQTNKIFLKYTDWDTIDKKEDYEKTVLWSAECSEGQLKDKFKEFIEWNKKWI